MNDDQGRTTATPRLIDSGTFFPEIKICMYCTRQIELASAELGPLQGVTWVHSDGKSRYCNDRGN